MYKTFYLWLLFLVISGCIDSETEQETARKAIISANDMIESAYFNGNASTVAEMMTEEVIISPVQLNNLNGRNEVESILSSLFETTKVIKYNLKPNEIEVYDDVAYERGTYVWISVIGKDTSRMNGRYSAVRHQGQDGKWRIHRLIENTVPSQ